MENSETYSFLRTELEEEMKRYKGYCNQKIALASSFLGIGSINIGDNLNTLGLLLLAPLIALAYDFYIVSSDYRSKRIGNYLRIINLKNYKEDNKTYNILKSIRNWEVYVLLTNNYLASWAFLPTTLGINILALVVWYLRFGLSNQSADNIFNVLIWSIFAVVLIADFLLAHFSRNIRQNLKSRDCEILAELKNLPD